MSQAAVSQDQRVSSYMTLRKGIGWIGTLLPFAVAIINMLLVSAVILKGSVSGYYYTGARNVLVGGLCAIGVFLFAYRGHDEWDRWITNVAGLFAIGVAFCPTAPAHPSSSGKIVGYFHGIFAFALFATLAVIALWLFRKTKPGIERKREKRLRDLVYLICGIVIVLCIALVPVESLVIGAAIARFHPMFWLETFAILAFGVAWLVKGQAFLKDRQPQPGTAGPATAGPAPAGPAPEPAGLSH